MMKDEEYASYEYVVGKLNKAWQEVILVNNIMETRDMEYMKYAVKAASNQLVAIINGINEMLHEQGFENASE